MSVQITRRILGKGELVFFFICGQILSEQHGAEDVGFAVTVRETIYFIQLDREIGGHR